MVDLVVNTLEEQLRARLATGNPSYGERIYPLRMPATNQTLVFPLLVYKRISAPRIYTQEGTSLANPRVQFSIWAKKNSELVTASEEVKARLDGWRDESAGIQSCFIAYELDQWEEQTGLFRKILDAQIGWKGY